MCGHRSTDQQGHALKPGEARGKDAALGGEEGPELRRSCGDHSGITRGLFGDHSEGGEEGPELRGRGSLEDQSRITLEQFDPRPASKGPVGQTVMKLWAPNGRSGDEIGSRAWHAMLWRGWKDRWWRRALDDTNV